MEMYVATWHQFWTMGVHILQYFSWPLQDSSSFICNFCEQKNLPSDVWPEYAQMNFA